MLEGLRPKGVRLVLYKALIRGIDAVLRPPRTTTVRRIGIPPGWWIAAEHAEESEGVVLHLHGGAFVLPPMHRASAAVLSGRTGMPVFLPRYRRPPAHPFPAAGDDALAAYRVLLARGVPAERIRLSGDSAGGFLALALLGDLGRAGLPLPAAVHLMSPLIDLTGESAIRCDNVQRDPVSSPRLIVRTNKAYVGETSLSDPRLDLFAADSSGWPPILIQIGETECLTEENMAFAEHVNAAGGHCELQLWPAQTHGFPVNGLNRIPEARIAFDHAVAFLTAPPGDGHRR